MTLFRVRIYKAHKEQLDSFSKPPAPLMLGFDLSNLNNLFSLAK